MNTTITYAQESNRNAQNYIEARPDYFHDVWRIRKRQLKDFHERLPFLKTESWIDSHQLSAYRRRSVGMTFPGGDCPGW